MTKLTWDDIGYSAEFKLPAIDKPHYVDVRVFDHEPTEIFSGSIKWDGCANFGWADEGVALHLCGPAAAADFATMLRRVFDAAREELRRGGCYVDFGPEWLA